MIKILDGFPRIVFLETMISMFMSFVDNLTSPLMIGESKKKVQTGLKIISSRYQKKHTWECCRTHVLLSRMKNGTKMSHFGFELQNHTTIKIVQFGEVFFAFVILKWNSRFRPTFWKEQKRAKLS